MTQKTEIPPEVVDVVRRCIAESLAKDLELVKLESRLIDDLDADSLDFVDIIFMLEKKVGIKMRENEMNFLTRLDLSSPEIMKEGFLTPAIVDRLDSWLPGIATLPDRTRLSPRDLFSLITVEAICIAATRQLKGIG